ncbi:MAG: hypothetical protein H0T68_13995 [Gemmatimonadales bacterium]|nr:hypothetical protein [Gemmatimonadales bacterium]
MLSGSVLLSRRLVLLLVLTGLAAVAALAEFRSILRPDIAFLLYAAERVLNGAKLYVDVVEINPPLIVGFNLLAVIIGSAFDLPAALVYRTGVLLLAGATLCTSAALLRRLLPDEAGVRAGLILLAGLVLLPMPAVDYGQREHLMLALFMPYLWLVAMRVKRVPVGAPAAAMLGVLAGIGVGLKPHFLLGWLALETYRRLSTVKRLGAPAPESTAVLVVLFVYSLFVLLATPDYLLLAHKLGRAYARFLYKSAGELLLSWPAAILLMALLSYVALRSAAKHREVWDVLLLGSLAFFAGGLLQQKGLPYHFYPSLALATMLIGLGVLDIREPLLRLSERMYQIVASASLLTIVTAVVGTSVANATHPGWGGRPDVPFERLVEVVRRHAAGGTIFVFSYHIGSAFPLVNYAGVESASRFPQLWILAGEYVDRMRAAGPLRYRLAAEMSPAERYLNQSVLADLRRGQPHLLLVHRNARDDPANGLRRLDYLAYFGRDHRFAELFARYEFLDRIGEYVLYRRLAAGESRNAPMPAASTGTLDVQLGGSAVAGERRAGRATSALAAVFLLVVAASVWREAKGVGPARSAL